MTARTRRAIGLRRSTGRQLKGQRRDRCAAGCFSGRGRSRRRRPTPTATRIKRQGGRRPDCRPAGGDPAQGIWPPAVTARNARPAQAWPGLRLRSGWLPVDKTETRIAHARRGGTSGGQPRGGGPGASTASVPTHASARTRARAHARTSLRVARVAGAVAPGRADQRPAPRALERPRPPRVLPESRRQGRPFSPILTFLTWPHPKPGRYPGSAGPAPRSVATGHRPSRPGRPPGQ